MGLLGNVHLVCILIQSMFGGGAGRRVSKDFDGKCIIRRRECICGFVDKIQSSENIVCI